MLLNASPSLEAGARVVTLFVRYPSRHLVLAHLVNGRWELHYPKPIAAPSIGSSNLSTDGLLAFQFAGLGFFWLLDSPLDTSSLTQQAFPAPSARELLGGGWIRALAPIFAVAFALTLGWSFSVFVHWTQRSKGN